MLLRYSDKKGGIDARSVDCRSGDGAVGVEGDAREEMIQQVASFEWDNVQPHAETLGLNLQEGKTILNSIQAVVLEQ